MDNFNSIMEEKFMPLAAKLSSQRHLLVLRDGLITSNAIDDCWIDVCYF